MNPELKEKIERLRTTVLDTGNRYEIDLLNHVDNAIANIYLDETAYKEMNRLIDFITTCTKIYEPKRKRDINKINNILEIVQTYSDVLYNNITKREEDKKQVQERRAAFKVV